MRGIGADLPAAIPQPNLGKFVPGVSLLSWGYNEEELIEGFLERALVFLDGLAIDYEMVFVDDGSTDRTAEIADSVAARNPHLRVIRHGVNKNVGAAVRTAITNAGKEFLFWQTVDWSYDIDQSRIFLELTKYYDVVQGVRPVPIRILSHIPVVRSIYRVKNRSDNFKKAIVSLGNYYLLRFAFGVSFHDFQNVTYYRTKQLQSLDLKGDSSFINAECLIRTYATGASFIEVPIRFIPRNAGEAKGTRLTSILRSIRDISLNWLKWGWRIRLRQFGQNTNRIHRVFSPFSIMDEAMPLIWPLLRYFR